MKSISLLLLIVLAGVTSSLSTNLKNSSDNLAKRKNDDNDSDELIKKNSEELIKKKKQDDQIAADAKAKAAVEAKAIEDAKIYPQVPPNNQGNNGGNGDNGGNGGNVVVNPPVDPNNGDKKAQDLAKWGPGFTSPTIVKSLPTSESKYYDRGNKSMQEVSRYS